MTSVYGVLALDEILHCESVMPSRSSVIVVELHSEYRLSRKVYLIGEHEHNDSVGVVEGVVGAGVSTVGNVVGGGVLK